MEEEKDDRDDRQAGDWEIGSDSRLICFLLGFPGKKKIKISSTLLFLQRQ